MASQFPDATHVGQRLLGFASGGERDMRLGFLRAAAMLHPLSANGMRFVELLSDADDEIVLTALGALDGYVDTLSTTDKQQDVVRALERLIGPSSTPGLKSRCSAIELLGRFGEVDDVLAGA